MLWLKGVLFSVIIPGTVAVLIPWLLIQNRDQDIIWGHWNLAGLPLLITGIVVYSATLLSFLLKGKGTPAIWFTSALSWLIGKEPVKMVSSGLYKYSRNPMYLGVLLTILGEGIFIGYSIILLYVIILSVIFHFVVILIEEPHLNQKFGEEYMRYKNKTRRWL